jgi:hypothetical protein
MILGQLVTQILGKELELQMPPKIISNVINYDEFGWHNYSIIFNQKIYF